MSAVSSFAIVRLSPHPPPLPTYPTPKTHLTLHIHNLNIPLPKPFVLPFTTFTPPRLLPILPFTSLYPFPLPPLVKSQSPREREVFADKELLLCRGAPGVTPAPRVRVSSPAAGPSHAPAASVHTRGPHLKNSP